MKKALLASLILLLARTPGQACTMDGTKGIVEDNDLYISVLDRNARGISEEKFNSVIDKIEGIYGPIIKAKGKTLQVIRNWTDGTVNAYAQQTGNTWKVSMFGGLARHETITADGFALVVCHEIGHHLGGAPQKKGMLWQKTWASNEGQSDYWGTMKCMRRYMEGDDNISMVSTMAIPQLAKDNCAKTYGNAEDVAMCERTAMAGMSLAELFRVLRKLPNAPRFDTPDTKVVSKTNDSHPAPQCRLDTYFQGALCNKGYDLMVSNTDAEKGVCTKNQGDTIGLRPNCWYKAAANSGNGNGGGTSWPF